MELKEWIVPSRHSLASAIGIGATGLCLVSSLQSAGGQVPTGSPGASYVAPPMHLEVWPLSQGSEFVDRSASGVVLQGQTLVLRVTLRNLWHEPIEVATQTEQWHEALQLSVAGDDGQIVREPALPRPKDQFLPRPRQAGSVISKGEKLLEFGADGEEQIERRFEVRLPPGHYRFRFTLQVLVAPPGVTKVMQQVVAETLPVSVEPVSSRATQLELLFREALLAHSDNRLADADENVRTLLALSPTSSAAHILRGQIARSRNDRGTEKASYQEAAGLLERGADTDSKSLDNSGNQRLKNVRLRLTAIAKTK